MQLKNLIVELVDLIVELVDLIVEVVNLIVEFVGLIVEVVDLIYYFVANLLETRWQNMLLINQALTLVPHLLIIRARKLNSRAK